MLKLISHVITPIQLLPQGIKKTVIIKFNQFGYKFFPPYGQLYSGINCRRSRIQGDQKLLTSALYLEANDTVIRHNDWADVKIVRAYRCDDKILRSRRN